MIFLVYDAYASRIVFDDFEEIVITWASAYHPQLPHTLCESLGFLQCLQGTTCVEAASFLITPVCHVACLVRFLRFEVFFVGPIMRRLEKRVKKC